MRQGLNGAGDGLLFILKINKNYPVGENRKTGRAEQGRAESAYNRGTYDNELAQDCKHKEIIKGANEEGNEERQVRQINQQSGNKMV